MPKIRERAPMDKVKTKGVTNPKQKKNPAQISRQIEKAAKEKVEQRKDQEASNESAVTTTEQAAIDVTHKAGEISRKVADAVYGRVLLPQTGGHSAENGANTATPESSAPVFQGRNLAAQKAAQQSNVQSPFEPAHGEIRDTSPKTKQAQDLSSSVLPKTREMQAENIPDSVVEQGRRLAIQKYRQTKMEEAKEALSQLPPDPFPQSALKPDETGINKSPTLSEPATKQRIHKDSAPKQKPKSLPKTRETIAVKSPPVASTEKVGKNLHSMRSVPKVTEMGRRKFIRESQKQLAQQAQKASNAMGVLLKKAATAIVRAVSATISTLVGIFGSIGLVAILLVVLLIGAILASPFGILFSNESATGAIPLSSAVGQISMEFADRLNALQEGPYADIAVTGNPPKWIEVIAVFACHVAGGEDGVDVMELTEEKVDKLRTVFWDMCSITVEEETEKWTGPTDPTAEPREPVVHLTITIEAKTADDMRLIYHFNKSQNTALTDLLAEEDLLLELIGDMDISQENALEVLNRLPGDISESRKAIVRRALTLVGKVNYFWGGKSLVIGWDSRWGQPSKVSAAGSPSTGTIRPYGLDCSGFVDWVFYNVSGGAYIMGHGGGVATQHTYCEAISWEQAQPGDLVFYPDDSHVGIVGGWDDAGNIQIIHCASGLNNVVITGKSGFATVGRPYYYGE